MGKGYENFKLAIYCTAGCLNSSLEQIAQEMDFFEKHLKVSKVYIENHRGDVSLSRERLMELKSFFEARGIQTAGGITPTLGEAYRPGYSRLFGGICYTEEASRAKFQEAVENAAAVFDEVIFDDFFFTNCGCDDCLARKGDRSWEEFRLELMTEVSENLIMKPARAVNPNSKMIIKFPNWNEAYQATGYNTEKQPVIFDGIYTGTETRDPAISQQHIPRYASYSLLRWMENLKPGSNGGGWFDSLDCTYIDYYLEQAYLTVFGKAKELTLFCYSLLKDSLYIPPLGFQLDKLDPLAGRLGQPLGVLVYEPHHAKGEDHLYDYLGMLGIPMEPTPQFPNSESGGAPLLLTADAARDSEVLERMKLYLKAGGQIIMTSGFIEKLQGKGIEEFTTLRVTGKKLDVSRFAVDTSICTFDEFTRSAETITYPVLEYSTNGTWQSIVALEGQNNIPVLMYDNYSKGKVYTLVIPDNVDELRKLPVPVVTKIREICTSGMIPSYSLQGSGGAGWFAYDNDTFVVENFSVLPEKWNLNVRAGYQLETLSGRPQARKSSVLEDGSSQYEIKIYPSSFAAFRIQPV
ncbi:permease [Paenibacillus hexagrammi]|uniref:Permease n=1 Tax=Paenibacillus hexagrammi TaxID=2908839 RepID=A0ABY3SD53_9BACL|nr:permease [Paenibacillus sp. YPD9-1]UJF31927.1 permease [Paenibacillus sp. YPD9-1]